MLPILIVGLIGLGGVLLLFLFKLIVKFYSKGK